MAYNFYEFFAGGGMVRCGFGNGWQCLLANDIDAAKAAAYRDNWGDRELLVADIAALRIEDLPGAADLAWASFPCQDLSLAGAGAGLTGKRSGLFWEFIRLMSALRQEERAPAIIAIENVVGTLSSNGGRDFAQIADALVSLGYRFGALVVDAVQFVPQSRPRLFVIGLHREIEPDRRRLSTGPNGDYHPASLVRAWESLPEGAAENWLWWRLPAPAARNTQLADLIETDPKDVGWNSARSTAALIDSMSEINLNKIEALRRTNKRAVGSVYKRTRQGVVRAEVRFDGVAGCLRTPAGGSSRQTVILVGPEGIRTRLLSAREAARLMGLPDDYRLPENYNAAYHLAGDGVAVPVARHLSEKLFKPLLECARRPATAKLAA